MGDLVGGSTPPDTTTTTTTTTTPPADGITYPENFPAEFHGNNTVDRFYNKETKEFDYGGIMTSLMHAQKMVGGNKLLVPTKDSTPDEWADVFKKLGLPEREAYSLGIDEMTKGFIDKAHELGVLPHQAKGIVEYFNAAQKDQELSSKQKSDDEHAAAVEGLKNDWKGSYEDNINAVNQTLDKVFTDAEKQGLSEAGYFSDPLFIKAMYSVAQKTMDDSTFAGQQVDGAGNLQGEQALRDEYKKVYSKLSTPEGKNSPALAKQLQHILEQAAKKGVNVYE